MLTILEEIGYIKYEPVLLSNEWTILMFSNGRAKGSDTKLDTSKPPRFLEDFQHMVTTFNPKLDKDAENTF